MYAAQLPFVSISLFTYTSVFTTIIMLGAISNASFPPPRLQWIVRNIRNFPLYTAIGHK